MKCGIKEKRRRQQEVRICAYLMGDSRLWGQRLWKAGAVFRQNPLPLGSPSGGRALAHGYVRVDTS
jgi:hypothetical protein